MADKAISRLETMRVKNQGNTNHSMASWAWIGLVAVTAAIAGQYLSVTAAVLSCSVLIVSALLMRRISDPFDFQKLSLISFWYLSYLGIVFLPSFFVYADHEGPYRLVYLVSVQSVLVTVPLGMVIARGAHHSVLSTTEHYFESSLDEIHPSSSLVSVYAATLVLALFGSALYLRETPVVPLIEWLRHTASPEELITLREESFKLLNSKLYLVYYLLRSVVYPFLILVGFGYYLETKRKLWLFLWLAALAAGLTFGSLSLAKGPAADLIFVMAIFLYLYRKRKVNVRLLIGTAALFFAFPMAVASSMVQGGLLTTFGLLLERVFYLPCDLLYYYFEIFPSHVGYLHGGSSMHLSSLFGTTFFDTSNYVGLYYDPSLESIAAPAAFIGDLNADFGLWGVVLGGIAAGWIMQTFHFHVIKQGKSVVTLSCYAFLVFVFMNLSVSALPTALASGGAIPVLLLTWFFEKSSRYSSGSLQLQT